MGFAWHKLIPRKTIIACPPPCSQDYAASQAAAFISSICGPINPVTGTQICLNIGNTPYQYGGKQCGNKDVVSFGTRDHPNEPIVMRLNTPLDCTGENSIALNNLSPIATRYEMGTSDIFQQYYYYRTPNSPSSTPTEIASEKLCLRFNPLTIPDRLMIISARNRYKYGGWHVDPASPTAGAEGGPPLLWDPVTTPAGGTGIRQAEELSLSRSWPLPNSVLNLPLFGANVSPVSNPFPTKCGDGACSDFDSCSSVITSSGTGHYGSAFLGNGKGYYSFQCFNPMGYVDTGADGGFRSLPTCSVWSLVQALWYQAWKTGVYGSTEADNQANDNPAYTPFVNLLAADPSQSTNDKSNVVHHLGLFKTGLENAGISTIMPNIFLWDKDAYIAAGSNANKWKHIYIVGNANVIFDTQCMGTQAKNGSFGFVVHLDEVAHDPEYGSTGNARLFGFYGCDGDNPDNGGSVASFGIKTMNCATAVNNPKTGDVNSYCDECANEGSAGGGEVTQDCYHYGHNPNCPIFL